MVAATHRVLSPAASRSAILDTPFLAGYRKSMKNYFDIATPAEIEEAYGYMPDAEELAEERARCEKDPDENCENLAALFFARGDTATADKYLEKIQDPERQLTMSMLLSERFK